MMQSLLKVNSSSSADVMESQLSDFSEKLALCDKKEDINDDMDALLNNISKLKLNPAPTNSS